MKSVDLLRWALIAPNNDTGLGRMAQDMKSVLPLGRHLVTNSEIVRERPLQEPRDVRLSSDCTLSELKDVLDGMQGVIFFEKHTWHPLLLKTTREMGIRSVCVPMWEWFRGRSPSWRNVDFFACPNALCLSVVKSYGFAGAKLVNWPLDLRRFPPRRVSGAAKHFVHNAGMIDPDDRKGTRDAIAAFASVRDPSLRLTVRIQAGQALEIGDPRISISIGSLPDPAALYSEGDAFIQPSKLEGMGFMVLEAVASGLPVITLDAPPMNVWSRHKELLTRPRRMRYPAYSSAWIEHSHLCVPDVQNLARKITWASSHDLEEISSENRAWAETTFQSEGLLREWEMLLQEVIEMPIHRTVCSEPEPPFPCHSLPARMRTAIESFTGWRLPFLKSPLKK